MRHLAAILIALVALLVAAADASANFVYWANGQQSSIGRAKINGTGANSTFIGGLTNVHGVAVDSKFIYWTQGIGASSTIGRANLDGSGANPNFIPNSAALGFAAVGSQAGIAVTSSAIYWVNTAAAPNQIGRAGIDGSGPAVTSINPGADPVCGIAADQTSIYWLQTGLSQRIGRANADGSGAQPNFIPGAAATCGIAVDPNFLYWGATGQAVGRAPVGGGAASNTFIPNAATAPNSTCGVAVNSQYVFWGSVGASDLVGRANLGGDAPNPALVSGPTGVCLLMAAAPSNKITINSITKKTAKGTAIIDTKVSGPGQVTLNQVSTPPDVNATAAAVKQIGLTVTAASSFTLAVKPVGKTAKKLNKQIKKQLRKKRKAKATAKQTVFIHFVPSGVAGVPNTQQVNVTLVKQRKKKH